MGHILHSQALRQHVGVEYILRINQARNFNDFEAAVHLLAALPLGFVYGDTLGNIGSIDLQPKPHPALFMESERKLKKFSTQLDNLSRLSKYGNAISINDSYSGYSEINEVIDFNSCVADKVTYNPEEGYIVIVPTGSDFNKLVFELVRPFDRSSSNLTVNTILTELSSIHRVGHHNGLSQTENMLSRIIVHVCSITLTPPLQTHDCTSALQLLNQSILRSDFTDREATISKKLVTKEESVAIVKRQLLLDLFFKQVWRQLSKYQMLLGLSLMLEDMFQSAWKRYGISRVEQ